jgi:hypothetical protein
MTYDIFQNYRFEWNKGEQPWCRSREKENFFIWLAAISGAIGIIILIVSIFVVCWFLKQKRRQAQRPESRHPGEKDSRYNGVSPDSSWLLKN